MSVVVSKLESLGSMALHKAWTLLDSFFPAEKRAEWIAKLKAFTVKHPKVMSFLLTNLALSGLPLALFVIFGITVLVFAIVVALVVGLLCAVLFTVFCLGVALCILFPVVFFTTLTAVFLFLLALGGYYAIKWMNKGDRKLPTAKGDAIGDQISSLTGGKLDWVMGQVREGKVEQSLGPMQAEWREPSARNSPAPGTDSANGHAPKKLNKSKNKSSAPRSPSGKENESESTGVSSGMDAAKNGSKVAKGVGKHANADSLSKSSPVTSGGGAADVGKKATDAGGNATGTVKGTVGGATGLA